MRDEDKIRGQLIEELAELRKRVADLEIADAKLKRTEGELLNKIHECQTVMTEREGNYRTSHWNESMLKQSLRELSEKNTRLSASNRYLVRKRITLRILAVLFFITLLTLGAAVFFEKFRQSTKGAFRYDDPSYRPMDLERAGEPHSSLTGRGPAKDRGKGDRPPGR